VTSDTNMEAQLKLTIRQYFNLVTVPINSSLDWLDWSVSMCYLTSWEKR